MTQRLSAIVDCLAGEIAQRGALLDDVAGAGERFVPVLPYPRWFAELLDRHLFAAFEVGGVRVYGNVNGQEAGLEELLADRILTRALAEAGFAPFGRPTTGSYDRVCFDLRGLKVPLDAPVVLMDHEAILSGNRIPKPKPLAGGFVALFGVPGCQTPKPPP
jgi:hypothetical protein